MFCRMPSNDSLPMIRLTKAPSPRVLVDRGGVWTDEFARRREGDLTVPGAALTRYRHPEIKAAVVAEANGKCIYCESLVQHVYPGDVEHMKPKSRFPQLVVDWENLAFVCSACNSAKGDYFEENEQLVNPFEEDPDNFFVFYGPIVFARDGNLRGIATRGKLRLDRAELIERRTDQLRSIGHQIETWAALPAGAAKDEVARELRSYGEPPAPYSAFVRNLLLDRGVIADD